ncbi:MAG: polysaccharide deacetylase family protein [Bacteriovoracaceae bacterium]|nr:polysaccharide deacetylase family protein [Bacteriovoracaceae bacterium]
MRTFKLYVLYILKHIGFFKILLFLNRKKLRILCYHGLSYRDEHRFSPGLFMTPDTFKMRIDAINALGLDVLPLEDAVNKLFAGELKRPTVVITFDDGFVSTFELGIPILKQFSYPSTVYVTTYYQQKQNPIFRLIVQYFFWRTQCDLLDLKGYSLPFEGSYPLSTTDDKSTICWKLIDFAEQELQEYQRLELTKKLQKSLKIAISDNFAPKLMMLATDQVLKDSQSDGVDIQLHTHRHRLPENPKECNGEVESNKAILEKIMDKKLNHMCYPSGIWSPDHFACLRTVKVSTATTCDPGINKKDTNSLALKRYLDSEEKKQIEFEADICGVTDIILNFKRLFHKFY